MIEVSREDRERIEVFAATFVASSRYIRHLANAIGRAILRFKKAEALRNERLAQDWRKQ